MDHTTSRNAVRMAQVSHERGRFVVGPSGHPRFAGSSTGIYLADTVWTAVSPVATDADLDEAFLHRNNQLSANQQPGLTSPWQSDKPILDADDFAQSQDQIREHFCGYFKVWHPLFPFLDGRTMSQMLEEVFTSARTVQLDQGTHIPLRSRMCPAFPHLTFDQALVYSTIFRAVITLGSVGSSRVHEQSSSNQPNVPLDRLHDLRSPQQAMHLAHLIVSACQMSKIPEILALQGLLSVQIVLFGLRETRPAMHIGGLVTKIAYEAGLHRCPNRFLQTFRSVEERDLRKRIFYSLYSLERLLSAEFGIPLTMNDTDIDTCLPGDFEYHQPVKLSPVHPARSKGSHSPNGSTGLQQSPHFGESDDPSKRKRGAYTDTNLTRSPRKRLRQSVVERSSQARADTLSQERPLPEHNNIDSVDLDAETAKNARLQPALALTRMTRMVGASMETFNKSLEHRQDQSNEALSLRVNLDKWWNEIGLDLDDDPDSVADEVGSHRLKRDLGRIHRLLKYFDLRWRHLKPLIRIVEAFISPLENVAVSAQAGSSSPANVTGNAGMLAPPARDRLDGFAFHFAEEDAKSSYDPMEGDFFFDFDSFELHPASMWAYRPSIPNTPG
ncbi:hypothetical protein QFC21_006207 [Naganishia friedmannii]|uniref:Uncharacterized protein n=1 Tax=Naganishia friedmannii TaxID=89922 RepID=A0ACC2V5A9_9TREE|nr:hypothetical protein QFC21_006207 [Naganishia friedmannii]